MNHFSEAPMGFWLASLAMLLLAYLLGSTPSGYLSGRLLKGVDLRQLGSGSTGATNVLRSLGPWPAAAVLVVDLLKGAAAVVLVRWAHGSPFLVNPGLEVFTPWVVCLAGLAVMLGHSRSIWLGFSGGKSAATGLGVLLAMSWPVGLGAAATFIVVVGAWRRVSLGSMLAAAVAIALVWSLRQPLAYQCLVTAGGLYVIFLHRANIGRLLAGTEPRLGQMASSD